METAKQNLATKLTQLQITRDKTKDIGSSGIKSRIERQKNTLQTLGNAAEKARTTLEEIKIAGGGGGGEKVEDITTWSKDVERQIAVVDEDIVYLSNCLDEVEQAEIDKVENNKSSLSENFFGTETSLQRDGIEEVNPSGKPKC